LGDPSRDREPSAELAPGLRMYWESALPRLVVHEVSGESMLPTLRPGDLIYADPEQRDPDSGDLVVCRHPFRPLRLVKRLVERSPSGRLRVLGDHPNAWESQDSRGFGLLKPGALEGRVVLLRRRESAQGRCLRSLGDRAPGDLLRTLTATSLRLAGAQDAHGCEAHLELTLDPDGLWLTASASALPWLQATWLTDWLLGVDWLGEV
jgi:nickel-type superoxide dismutase maturation protease